MRPGSNRVELAQYLILHYFARHLCTMIAAKKSTELRSRSRRPLEPEAMEPLPFGTQSYGAAAL